MVKTIAILSTLDTKSDECGYLATEITRLGAVPLLVDIGVVGEAAISPNISADDVARAAGTTLGDLRIGLDLGCEVHPPRFLSCLNPLHGPPPGMT